MTAKAWVLRVAPAGATLVGPLPALRRCLPEVLNERHWFLGRLL